MRVGEGHSSLMDVLITYQRDDNPHISMPMLFFVSVGDVAYRLLDSCSDCEITVLDVNPEMLEEGQKRPNSQSEEEGIVVSLW